MIGQVSEFDEQVGLGAIAAGSNRFPFHCTQIADGSRRIEVGINVTFVVEPGRLGRWEAAAVRPYPSDEAPSPGDAPS